jgi:threonine dehydrogenase-like Zn-dependent dehydrogenase
MSDAMKAAVFRGHERIVIEERPIPSCGPTDAIVKISLTTICGTDVL